LGDPQTRLAGNPQGVIRFFECSLDYDQESIQDAIIEQLPQRLEAIIHTAGIVHSFDEESFYRINTEGTVYLAKAFLATNQVHTHFIFVSSLAAAGPSYEDKEQKELPVSHYGKSKLWAEQKLREIWPKSQGLTIIRPPMVIGPGDAAMKDVFDPVYKGLVLHAGLDSMRRRYSFICVWDLVAQISYLVSFKEKAQDKTQDKKNQILHLAYPKSFLYSELLEAIQKEVRRKKIYHIYAPQFIIFYLARILKFLQAVLPKIMVLKKLRLTPDKYKEIIQNSWICPKEQEFLPYYYNLDKTVEITVNDYYRQKKKY